VLAGCALLLAAIAVDGTRLWKQHGLNDVVVAAASGGVPVGASAPASAASGTATAPPGIQFALAYAQAASGATQEAMNRYRALQGDSMLGQAARYNSANLLMRQAIEVRSTSQPGQAIPLIELAKEVYREVLRNDPDDWNARYNLERAQRLLPDPDESIAAPVENKRDSERAVTTMRGYSPGMP
jgi:mxaK protein